MRELVEVAGEILMAVHKHRPRVHCVTNSVAENFTANVLLVAGAIPSMTVHPQEMEAFVSGAHGLLVNLGTPDDQRNEAITLAIDVAQSERIPWLLDPVFVERSSVRLERARELLLRKPTLVRGNSIEMDALERRNMHGFSEFCAHYETIAISTGAADHIESLERIGAIENGHPLMAQVTAMGCAMSAMIVAFCAAHEDVFEAAASAVLITGICGELAARTATGPGTYVPHFLDSLANVEMSDIATLARYSEKRL